VSDVAALSGDGTAADRAVLVKKHPFLDASTLTLHGYVQGWDVDLVNDAVQLQRKLGRWPQNLAVIDDEANEHHILGFAFYFALGVFLLVLGGYAFIRQIRQHAP